MELQQNIRGSWVQTERKAHEQWATLIGTAPRAAQLLHLLVANMDNKGALVVSQGTLSQLSGLSLSTVKRALTTLKDDNWIDVIRIGSERGGVSAYVVNRRVAWADKRENQRFAIFDARILVGEAEQDRLTIENIEHNDPLKQIPIMNEHEIQLPNGEGKEPPTQPSLDHLTPDLPFINS